MNTYKQEQTHAFMTYNGMHVCIEEIWLLEKPLPTADRNLWTEANMTL